MNLKVQIHDLKVQIHDLKVQIHDLKVQIHDLKVQIHDLKVQIHDLKTQIHDFGLKTYAFNTFSPISAGSKAAAICRKAVHFLSCGSRRVSEKSTTPSASRPPLLSRRGASHSPFSVLN